MSKFNWHGIRSRQRAGAATRIASDNNAYIRDLERARRLRDQRRHWSPERATTGVPLTKDELRRKAAEAFIDWRKRFGTD